MLFSRFVKDVPVHAGLHIERIRVFSGNSLYKLILSVVSVSVIVGTIPIFAFHSPFFHAPFSPPNIDMYMPVATTF